MSREGRSRAPHHRENGSERTCRLFSIHVRSINHIMNVLVKGASAMALQESKNIFLVYCGCKALKLMGADMQLNPGMCIWNSSYSVA